MDAYSNLIKNQTKAAYLPKKKEPLKTKTTTCYLGLGSNIGDSQKHIKTAIKNISNCKQIKFLKSASLYISKAWGNTQQNNFVNTVISISTNLKPQQLLKQLLAIEKDMGRERKEKWGPRIIDIDILLYGDLVVNQPHLTIPHPYITERSFVIAPLCELHPNLVIPNKGKLSNYYDKEDINSNIIEVV